MTRTAEIAWDDARAMYVEGIMDGGARRYPSMADIAQKAGVSHDAVRKRAAREKWTEQRILFQERLAQKRTEQVTERLAHSAAELDSRASTVANAGITRCAQLMLNTSSPVALSALASALRTFHAIGRLIHGEPTDNTGAGGNALAALLKEAREYEAQARRETAAPQAV
jgi:hypothetical protein